MTAPGKSIPLNYASGRYGSLTSMTIKFMKVLLSILFIFLNYNTLFARSDSTYYVSYPNVLTTRLYLSQKYTTLSIKDKKEKYVLHYLPNTTLNIGVGATCRWATLNLAYGFGFLNPNKGKTKYLDLQFHGYGKKFNLDVLGQFYRGFYLYPKRSVGSDSYYNRPDLRVNTVGASFQYVVNHKRFSFRSSILQNEWQKKSAGTILVGIEAYGGRLWADSTLVPTAINKVAASRNQKKNSFFQTGPNIGYAYTLVVRDNYFLTGSASVSFDYGFSTITDNEGEKRNYGVNTNTFFRICTGYNSAKLAITIVYVNNGVKVTSFNSNHASSLNAGNLRLNYVYRFVLKRRER